MFSFSEQCFPNTVVQIFEGHLVTLVGVLKHHKVPRHSLDGRSQVVKVKNVRIQMGF